MNSLQELNNYSNFTVAVTDNRLATVIFDRLPAVDAQNQILNVTSVTTTVNPGLEILEIVKSDTANVRYEITITPGAGWAANSTSIEWVVIPTGVTYSKVGNTYTLTGLKDVIQWETVSSFTWRVPSNYDISPLWYLTVKVIYFDEELGQDQERTWLAFDPDFYTVAQLNGSSSLACEARRLKLFNVQMNPQFTIIADEGLNQQGRAQLNVQASMNVVGEKTILENFSATLTSSFTQTTVNSRIRSNTAALNSQATAVISFTRILDYISSVNSAFTQTAVLTDAPFEYGIQGLGGYTIPSITGTGLIIDWGDGTQTTQFDAVTPTSRFKNYPGSSQQYTIKITGNLTSIRLGNDFADNNHRVRGITRFNNNLQSFSMQYLGTNPVNENLFSYAPTQIPRTLTNLNYTFRACSIFNQDISAWDTSLVTNMNNMFNGASAFDQDISTWCVELIPSKPTGFDTSTPASWTTAEKPNWGAPC